MGMKREDIYQLKAIAILCVICAHCGNRISYSEWDAALDHVRNVIAGIGVPIFFIISGYLFNNHKTFGAFWKGKVKHTVIPWLFWGTVIWAYEVMRKGLSYAKLWEWLLGINTYLWFLPIVMFFWFIYYFVKKAWIKKWILGGAIIAYILVYDILGGSKSVNNGAVNHILANLPFFAFGVFARDHEWYFTQNKINFKYLLFFIFLSVAYFIVFRRYENLIFIAGCMILFIMFIGKLKNKKIKKWLTNIGNHSYVIYLIHMPIAGVVSYLFSRNVILLYFVLVQPLIVIIVTEILVHLLQTFIAKNKYVKTLTGV